MTQPNRRRIALITGGSGFLGRHCLAPLVAGFDEVHATTTRATPPVVDGVCWHRADLLHVTSTVDLVSRIRPTHLLHLAWVTEHGHYWNSIENTRWLEASVQLVRAFAAWGGQRVVTAGTCAEYDWTNGHCSEASTRCAPLTLYGACKHALRLAVESCGALSAAHTRLFHLFGPHEDNRRLTSSVIRSLRTGRRASCTHGEQVRDFMYIKDAAAAHVKLLASDVRGPVNIAGGIPITIKEFVLTIGRLLRRPDAIDFGTIRTPANDPPVLTAEITRLRHEVCFSSQQALEHSLLETLRWHQATPSPLCPILPTAPFAAVKQPASF